MKNKKISELIQLAENNGVNFFIKNNRLGIRGLDKIGLSDDLLDEIKSRRAEIIDYLVENVQHRKLPRISKLSDRPDKIPLSYSQERLWIVDALAGSVNYHIPSAFRLSGDLDIPKLKQSLRVLLERHEILRTVYREEAGVGYQQVLTAGDFSIEEADVTGLTAQERFDTVRDWVYRPFDLSRDYCLRVVILKESEGSFLLVIVIHHIAADGWSMPIVIKEVEELYRAYQQGEQPERLALPIQYADYSLWQRAHLSGAVLADDFSYWEGRLKGVEPLQLPTDYARPSVQSQAGSGYKFSIGQALTSKLKALSIEKGATLFMTLLSVYKILLHRYTGQSDICVGIPIANREQPEIAPLVGFFVNTLALRTTIRGTDNFEQLLNRVKEVTLSAHGHQDAPFERVVERVVRNRDQSRSPLFQTMFVLQDDEEKEELNLGNVSVEPLEIPQETSKFDLTLSAAESSGGLAIGVEYCTDLFREDTIKRLSGHFKNIIKAVLADDKRPIGALNYLSDTERIELLETFANTAVVPYPHDKTLVDLFSEQVSRIPDHVAVVYEGETLTYRELDEKSNQLAHHLLSKGVNKEELVAICIERSIAMIVGILGIMKSGGAYVPMDSAYPRERIAYMLADTASRVVLSTSGLQDVVEGYEGVTPIYLDEQWEMLGDYPLNLPDSGLSPDNLAYVIYTSGSTGKPKGVLAQHKNVAQIFFNAAPSFDFNESDAWTMFHSYNFDFSVWEMYGALLQGGKLVLVPKEYTKDSVSLCDLMEREGVTILNQTTSSFSVLYEELLQRESLLKTIRHLIVGGEALPPTLVKRYRALEIKPTLGNIYGTTESTIYSTYYSTSDLTNHHSSVPVGKPMSNVQAYILDENLHLQPRGIVGELCMGGPGVARGYLNRPDLTAQKFVDNPFRPTERLYRTGDLARWLPDGNLEFIGRKDHQVKVRGYRIELGEIESQLQELPWIKQAVVLAKENLKGSKHLVGYVALEAGQELDRTALQAHLKAHLPHYMVPRLYVGLSQFPLTPNGKIDKKALPEPDGSALQRQAYIAPRNELELELVSIWQEVLGVDKIGVHDDFFELGGDSIKAIQLRSRIRKLGYDIKVRDLFEHQTIEKSVKRLRAVRQVQSEAGVLSGEAVLLPIQQRFFEAAHKEKDHYNQSALLNVSKAIKAEDLQAVIQLLSDQHDALRFEYELGASAAIQRYGSRALELDTEQVSGSEAIEDLCARYQRSLDIAQGPLTRIVWIKTPASEQANRLFITVHHLGVDGVSWRIVLEDLNTLLNQQSQGAPLALEPKQTSYRQWGARLAAYACSRELLLERSYWTAVLGKAEEIPQDTHYTGLTPFHQTRQHTLVLSQKQTRDLLRDTHQAYGTEINDLLLAALALTLAECLGGDSVVIGLEGHGREDLFDDIDTSKTVGWFTSLYPIALRATPGQSIGQQIIETKERLRGIPNKGIGYGVLRYLSKDETLRSSMQAAFDSIVFNYLGDLDNAITPPGGLFSQATESMGDGTGPNNACEHKMSINCIVLSGKLHMSWSYDSNRYEEQTIDALAARYEHYLSEVIAHCKGVEEPVKTASDYGLPGAITQSELEAFKNSDSHPTAIADLYPLSPLQEGLLFHSLYDTSGQAYLVHLSCDFVGGVDSAAFKAAWKYLSQQHSILRTAIYSEELSIPVQVVYQEVDIPITEIDYREVAADEVESKWSDYLLAEKHRGMDLSQAPLLRMSLVYLPDGRVKLLMTNHHILWDGWSFANLMGELIRLYACIVKGEALPALTADNYADLLRYINKQGITKGEAYWQGYLSEVEAPSYVPYIKDVSKRNERLSNKAISLDIPSELSEQLTRYSQSNGLTINTVLQGAWAYLLSRYNNQDTVVFGATVSGRELEIENIEDRIGLYINTLPVVTRVETDSRIADWLQALQSGHAVGRTDYSYVPLSRIQSMANIQGHLFDSLMVFENYPIDETLQAKDKALEIADIKIEEGNNYVLGLICYLTGEHIGIHFEYHDALLDKEAVERIRDHFVQLLKSMVSGIDKVGELTCLGDPERAELLETFANTAVAYPRDKTLVDLFSEQASRSPDHVAVVCEGASLTYRELDEKSNQLAHYLLSKGVKKEDLVAICIARSMAMIVGILGIVKSGGAYVPIDPAYPRARIAYMLEDTDAAVVLSTSGLRDVIGGYDGVAPIYLDEVWEVLGDYPSSAADVGLSPDNLAYVIYTSGSTGKPKGVLTEHRNVVRLFFNDAPLFDFNESDVWTMFHAYNFDFSVWEMYGALLQGGKLVLVPKEYTKDSVLFCELIEKQGVTVLNQTPSAFNVLQEEILTRQSPMTIRYVIFGGEALYPSLLEKWKDTYKACRLINMYGTTETTVHVSFKAITAKEIALNTSDIGVPIPTLGCVLLDEHMHLQPRGVVGELCIGGAGLARGYLNRPELTAQKFVENPFRPAERLYRTGDLARWLPDGNLEFIGRKDHQVKIRGYRIELGEIESQLQELPWIKQSVVLARQDQTGSKYLVGYVVLEVEQELDRTALQAHLKAQLPDYMVPQWYVALPQFPLTSNGKIDRKALPEPDGSTLQRQAYVAPRTELERELVSIWQGVLGVDKIGICDDFFELGGDSIKAIQLRSRIRKLDYDIKVRDLFEHQTIEKSVKHLRAVRQVQSEAGVLSGEAVLLPIQQRFFEAAHKEKDHYNQSALLNISKTIKAEGLQAVIQVLSDQHDALRFKYELGASAALQRYGSRALELDTEQVSGSEAIEDLCNRYQRSLDIVQGPLTRIVWIQTPASEQANRLFITVHHLGVDGVSWRIVLEDLHTLLNRQSRGESLVLEPKQTSFRQWGARLLAYADSKELSSEHSYWAAVLSKAEEIPQDTHYTGLTPFDQTRHHTLVLSQKQTYDLLRNTHQAYGTEINDLLLTALGLTLTEWLGDDSVVIGLEGHGREDLFDDIDITRTVGWFTSLYPVALRATPGQSIGHQIIETKERLRGIPNKGIGYSVLRYLSKDEAVCSAMQAAFDSIVFNYLGDLDTSFAPSEGLFSRAVESMGDAVGLNDACEHKLSINCMVLSGGLHMSWSYDSNRYEEQTIHTLAGRYEHYLSEIIAHCKGVEEAVKTVSDYGLPAAITQSELETFRNSGSHPAAIADLYPLSPLQEGLLFHSLYDTGEQAYMVHFSCDFVGGVDSAAFKAVWQHLSQRHSILRTAIYSEELAIPVQVVYQEVDIPITEIDYRDVAADEVESKLSNYLLEEKHREMDLSRAPLLRISLVYLPDARVKLLMTNHHILWDGWSFANLMGELMHLYECIIKGKALPEVVADNYVDLLRYINKQGITKGEAYWQGYLSEVEQPSYVPYVKDVSKRNERLSNAEVRLNIPIELSERLTGYSQSNGLTVNTLLQGAWAYLLSRYNNCDTVVFGATVSGRELEIENIEDRIGLYINTIPVATRVETDSRIIDWLQALQSGHTAARTDYSYVPLSRIQSMTNIQGHLFDSLMVFENYPLEDTLQAMDRVLQVAGIDAEEGTNYVLSLICYLRGAHMGIHFAYSEALLDTEAVERIGDHFVQLLESMVSGIDKVSELVYLSGPERIELLETFANTAVVPYPRDKTLVDLFSEQVLRTPHKVAVVYEDETLTYRELDEKSNQLAHYLLSKGVNKEELVAICIARSMAMVVGILGIMKSGGAYVPIDPAYPRERIAYMLADTASRVLLSTSTLHDVVEGYQGVAPIYLDEQWEVLGDYPLNLPDSGLSPDNLAYVIYTSGSTGKPKGVLAQHKNVAQIFFNAAPSFDFNESDAWTMFHSYNFDFSVWEMYGALLQGGKLVLVPKEYTKDSVSLCDLMEREGVTILNQTTSSFSVLYEELLQRESLLKTIRHLIVGGEALPPTLVKSYKALEIKPTLGNIYGTTESTIYSTYYSTSDLTNHHSSVPVGKPMSNVQAYILDENLHLQPRGIVGELCMGGPGVARGYLNRPDLTAQKFVDNPFRPTERLYRTGDLARWLPDGNLEFIGRKDHQVKVRGYRIELGEIESQLQELPWIKQAVVLAKENQKGSKYLVGYVALEAGQELDRTALQAHLKANLPDYMVPRLYVGLSQFPLTPNGKIDKKALPDPDGGALQRQAYVAPRTDLERELVSIWQEVLGVDKIGIYDDFFELGGDSIKAIQLRGRIRKLGYDIKVRDLFEHQTIEKSVRRLRGVRQVQSEAGVLSGEALLLPIQQRFFETSHKEKDHYNQSALLNVSKAIKAEGLQGVIQVLSDQHDALRFRYEPGTSAALQRYGSQALVLETEQVSGGEAIEDLCARYQRSLDIEEDPLTRIVWMQTPASEQANRLFITVHHLGVDGVSWRIVLEDLHTLLNRQSQGEPLVLEPKQTSFRQWGARLAAYACSRELLVEHSYWTAVLSKAKEIPQDTHYTGLTPFDQTRHHTLILSQKQTHDLLRDVHQAYGTEINDLLLTALGLTLTAWLGGDSVVIGLEGHGREDLFDDIDITRTVGWFTSLYPVALQASPGQSIGQQIIETKERLRGIPNKGIGYGVLRYLSKDETLRASMQATFDSIVFNYLGDLDTSFTPSQGLFSRAVESMGDVTGLSNLFEHKLSVNCIVSSGALHVNWTYDANRYEEKTIHALAARYNHYLSEVIAHCKGVEEPVKTVSDYGLPNTITQSELETFKNSDSHPVAIADLYPLSPLQEGLLFHSLYDTGGQAYMVRFTCDFVGGVAGDAFKAAWQHLSQRHSILRTAIYSEELAIPVQVVYQEVDIPITEIDYREVAAEEIESKLSDYLLEEKHTAMDLSQAPLLRMSLVYLPDDRVKLLMTHHHILWDGWSFANLMSELMHLYECVIKGEALPALIADNYVDLLRYINKQGIAKGEAYWQGYLSEVEEPSYVPYIKDVSKRNELVSNTAVRLDIPAELSERLTGYSQSHGLTVNTVLQGAWAYLLSRYNNRDTVAFGATVSGRELDIENIEDRIGLYINTLPVVTRVETDSRIIDWLQALQSGHTAGRTDYSYVPLNRIQSMTNIQGHLFDSLMVFENYPLDDALQAMDRVLQVAGINAEEGTNYVLSLICYLRGAHMGIHFGYNEALLNTEAVERIRDHFVQLLKSMVSGIDKISELTYLSDPERIELLETFANTAVVPYPRDKTLVDLFSEQVSRTPDHVAVVYEGETLTYRELDERSNQLAHYLLSKGVNKEELVAICIERSIAMIVGILGIVKSGGAYVPIDPAYPRERIAYMLADTASRVLLSTSALHDVVEGYKGVAPIYLDEQWEMLGDYPLNLPDSGLSPDNLAYVIYTSGSTGKPKGVLTAHKNVVRLFSNDAPLFDFNESDVWTMFHSYSFDFAVWEMYGALLQGGKLVLVPKEYTKDSVLFCELIEREGITILSQTPSSFSVLQEELLKRQSALAKLRYVIFAGETLPPSLIKSCSTLGIRATLGNIYGPTETTVYSTYYSAGDLTDQHSSVPIGKPINNVQVYILDEDLHLQPRGIVGELCIGGGGLARGYLNRPDLTAQKFVDNPFQAGGRLYRSGDLARWLPDGNLDFIGRKDHQVKIRGYRIELGEIESQLQDIPWIKQSVVLARQNLKGSKHLVGYVALEAGHELDRAAIQAHLKANLPHYMVPRLYVGLSQFPLTPNGKIDKKALPDPDGDALQRQAYVAPRTDLEQELVSIWQEVLGVDKIGIYDDFFELGGDSIKAIQLRGRIRKLGYDIKVRDLFEHQTIEKSVKRLRAVRQVQREAGVLSGEALLLPIQQRFFETSHKEKDHYNQSALLNISKAIKAEDLQGVIQLLSEQHDALRFRYEPGASAALQRYGSQALVLDTEQVSGGEAIEDLCNRYQRSLDIEEGPLTRIVWMQTPASEQANRLFITVHHLGIDGVSWRIVLEDLHTLLNRQSRGESLVLEPKQTSFRQWGKRLVAYACSRELLVERPYWAAVLSKAEEIPQDTHYTGLTPFDQTRHHTLVLNEGQTRDLLRDTHQAYGTEINDLLLTALGLTLTAWLGSDSVVIGLEGHGREDLFDDIDISKTVGWFTSLYPVALGATPGQSIGRQIIETKERLRGIPNKGIGYGVLRYLSKDKAVCSAMEAAFDSIVFNYLGDLDTSFAPSQGLFSRSVEPMGDVTGSSNLYEHKLSINCMVSSGALQVNWSYDCNRYEEKTIHTLAARYEHHLSEVIAHCKGVKEPVKTVSDYGLPAAITQFELETFKNSDSHPAAIADLYPLSPLQEGLLFHSLYDTGGQAYLVRLSCDFIGVLDSTAFKAAWQHLSQRHSILRTAIYSEELAIPVQVVYQEVDIPITEIDYREVAADEVESKLSDYLLEEKHRGMDLSQAPLLRMSLVYLPDDRVKLLMTHHHILWDGWSFANLMSELMHLYECVIKGEALPALIADNYVDLLRYINKQGITKGEAYWQGYLSEVEQPSYVPYIKDVSKRNELVSNTTVRLDIPAELSERLTGYSQSHGLTINTVLQGAWAYLLSRYNNRDTVVFGATVSGRELDIENIEDRIGLYINTLPVATRIDSKAGVVDWLQALQSGHTTGRTDYSYVPLNRIQSTTNIRGHLFDSIMVFENYPLDDALQAMDRVLQVAGINSEEGTNYVLSLGCYLTGKDIAISFGYHDALLDKEVVQRIRDHFVQLLESMASGVDKISELRYLTEPERIELLETFNDTAVAYPRDKTLVDLFSEQVSQTPDHAAVVCKGEALTYRELDEKSNQLAHHLLSKGVKKEDLVAICMERGIAMIVGILGIVKSGGAYVPIDPAYPRERIAYMLADTGSRFVLSISGLQDVVEDYDGVAPIYLDEQWEMLGDYPSSLPDVGLSPDHLAYVIYTSGSTGKPKGVMIEQGGLVNMIVWHQQVYKLDASSRGALYAGTAFDASVFEMHPYLTIGASLYPIVEDDTRMDVKKLSGFLKDKKITNCCLPPQICHEMIDQGIALEGVTIVAAGDVLNIPKSTNLNIYNNYGPTENTVVATWFTIRDHHGSSIPIGKPINNVQVYILGEDLHLQPRGIAGELYIGGIQVARGYLNRPELTARKFVDNPFQPGSRLYRTGDLARWLPDGNLEFLGRKDHQVKIRGYRIELGEIESQLHELPWVKQSVVLAKQDQTGSKYLVAYVVLETEQELDRTAIQAHLKAQLPDYMVPRLYIGLSQLPLTPNGKIDRKALPEPDGSTLQPRDYVGPRNELERDLVSTWQEVLGVDKIGVYDDFFELGGDSIKAMRVVSHIRAKSGMEINVRAIFDCPTIEELAQLINISERDYVIADERINENDFI